jgi:Heme exporter protein D (CcmD)
MNHWAFVTAAYIITGLGTGLLLVWAVLALRRAEASVSGLDDQR